VNYVTTSRRQFPAATRLSVYARTAGGPAALAGTQRLQRAYRARCEYLLRVQTRGRTGETLSWRLSSPTRIRTSRMDEGYFELILMIHLLGLLDASSMTECTFQ
jgi:hypothetical protein